MMVIVLTIVYLGIFSAVSGTRETDLDVLQQDFFNWFMLENPQYATSINIHKYDDRLDDYSTYTFDRWKAAVDNFLKQLRAIPRDLLSDKYKVDYDVFENFLMTYHIGYEWKDFNSLNPLNFLEGPHIDPDYLVGITPKNTRGDFENFLARLEGFPQQISQIKSRFQKAVEVGRTYHNVSIFKVQSQIAGSIPSNLENHSFYGPFKEYLDNATTITENVKTELRNQAKSYVEGYLSSLQNLSSYLHNNYSYHLRQGYGVSAWDNGSDFYQAVLQWHISLPLTPDEVHQKGLDEVERISKQMKKIMRGLGLNGTVKEAFDVIKNDSGFYYDTGEKILRRFNEIIHQEIEPKLPLVFKNLPNLPVEVQPMPNDGPGGQYLNGAADGSRPGIFQVNLKHPNEMLSIDFIALALHETNPGHHLQISIQQLAKLPEFRKNGILEKYFQAPALFPFFTAYVEGWALYAESLGEEMGVYKTQYDLLGRYASEIFRACRLVVDTGLHYKNWTRERAINFMQNYTALGESDIATEIDRYITWPGQACAYKIGELKIRELRNKANLELGDKFDLKDFHSVVLENGPVPLSTLETIVDAWIEKTKTSNARTSEYPEDDLKNLQSDYADWLLSKNPESARYMNIRTYDTEIEDFSLGYFDDLKDGVDDFLIKLDNIPRSLLNAKSKVDFDIFKDTLTTYRDGYQWRWYTPLNPVNFLDGPQIDPGSLLSVLPRNMTLKDFENYVVRLEKRPKQIYQYIALMEKAIDEGHTNHNVSMSRVTGRFDQIITNTPEEFPWYKPFNGTLDNATDISDQKKGDLRTKAKNAIESYLKSLTDLRDYIQNQYSKHLRTEFGVSSWNRGQEFYKACLKWHLSLDITPEEVHSKGLSEVKRISTEIQKIFKKLNLTGTTKEVFDKLKHDPQFLFNDSSKILDKYKEIIFGRIKPKLPMLFKELPDLPLEVQPSPTDGPGGMYMQGSSDGSRPGIFYANLFHPDESPTFNFADLALHEALPGHHLQLSYQITSDIPLYRTAFVGQLYMAPATFPSYTAYIEGWALYAEALGEEMKVFNDDYELLGRYSAEIFRACRLVVDTGLHYFNWTDEKAINYMLNYTAYGKSDITNEVHRYITWPGQACAYKIGELKIRELRHKAETELGDKFNIADFHLVILKNGAMPLTTMETIVDTWINDVKNSGNEGETPGDILTRLQNSFSDWLLYENPEFTTILNDPRYNDRLDDYSINLFDRWKNKVDYFLDELRKVNKDQLSQKQKTDFDIFDDFLKTYQDGYKWRMYNALNPINFLEGPQSDPDAFAKIIPKNTKGDFDNFITRIENMPIQLKQMKERFMKAMELNHTYNKVSIESVPGDILKLLTNSPEDFAWYSPFKDDLDRVSTIKHVEKINIRERAKVAINDYMTALKDLSDFINGTYLNHARTGSGVRSWDNGVEYYKACLKWHTSLSITPEEVHRKGLEEVSRISGQMKKIFNKLGMSGSVKDGFNSLKNDSSFFLKSGDEVVATFEDIVFKQITPKLGTIFKDIPDLPLVIEAMSFDGPGGMYSSGSPDGTKPGRFLVNAMHPDEIPSFSFKSLALHETVPGHHLQISVQSLSDNAGFRKYGLDSKYFQPPTLFPFYTAFVEGWALYSEYLGEELGIYKDDYQMLGRYSDEIFRACRLVVDTGLHYMGWSRERAINYMKNYTASGDSELSTEIDRYITWPGQACAYKMGELKIKELRKKATDSLGSNFDIKDFHSVLLQNGPMPLSTLETIVDQWIQEVQSNIPKPKRNSNNTNSGSFTKPSTHLYLLSILVFTVFKLDRS